MSVPESKNKRQGATRQALAVNGPANDDAFEEISLTVEPYSDVPIVATSQQIRKYPDIYETDGTVLPFGASLDYES